jgi:hypothetical protein
LQNFAKMKNNLKLRLKWPMKMRKRTTYSMQHVFPPKKRNKNWLIVDAHITWPMMKHCLRS